MEIQQRREGRQMNDLLHRLGLAVVSMKSKAGGWPWLSHGPEIVCALLDEAIAEIRRLERLASAEMPFGYRQQLHGQRRRRDDRENRVAAASGSADAQESNLGQ